MKLLLCAGMLVSVMMGYNGSVESIGEIEVVNLWGTWSEMGYAHGRLLGPDLMQLYEGYFLELAGGTGNVEMLRSVYGSYFTVPDEFRSYAAGIISGAADTVSLYSNVYGRDLDTLDIYITSSVPDLSAMVDMPGLGCSSVSAWGGATAGDPQLQGEPAVSRNLDYFVDSGETILGMSRLFVFDPHQGLSWVSVSFPGFMGSLSGMNEEGVNATLNMGNYQGTSQTSPSFVPICMAITLGLSREDFDGSGSHDIQDLKSATTVWNRANSYDIHITVPTGLAAGMDPAVIAEVNNHLGHAFREAFHEPSTDSCSIILTNHHRVLYPPVACYRYQMLLDSLAADPAVTAERLWGFMEAVGYTPVPGNGGTLQTMTFLPHQRAVGLAFASSGVSAAGKDPQWIQWNDIYPNHDPQGIQPGSDPHGFRILQNPAGPSVRIAAEGPVTASVHDLSGRRLDAEFIQVSPGILSADISALPGGIYVISVSGTGSETGLALFVHL